MRQIIEEILAAYARIALAIHKPKIIGITGSVGKSSTKEAIACVLSGNFSVRKTSGNLNSQLGLPLAVLGFAQSGGFRKNFPTMLRWLGILIYGFFRIFDPNYPKILVLEMGTDKPGDIATLLSIVGRLDVAVITDIGISHLEFFKNPDALKKEKLSILEGLGKRGLAVLNAENPKVMEGRSDKYRCITYGFEGADIVAQDYRLTEKNNLPGVAFNVSFSYKDTRVPFFVPNTIGKPTVYSSLAAACVGMEMGMNLVEISERIKNFAPPAGRLHVISGMHHSTIIDDTYNAAPSSTIAAIDAQKELPATRYVLALGGMAELGKLSEAGHREVAAKIVESQISLVFLVGENTKFTQDELEKRKFSGKILWSQDSEAAAEIVAQYVLPGDTILVKGSQSARMERVVKKIMQHPQEAPKMLVRQGADWL